MAQDLNIALVVRANTEQARREMAATGEAVREVGTTAQVSSAQAVRGITAMGQASNAARAHVTNLSFQINDVAMMMAMGQNPFMLAMQQGTQVSQVLGQMRADGLRLGPALASAFTMFVNPMTLATLAVIGFGSAVVQWFTRASEEALSLEDAVSEAASRLRELTQTNARASASLAELAKDFGTGAARARDMYGILAQIQRMDAVRAIARGAEAAAQEMDGAVRSIRSIQAMLANAQNTVEPLTANSIRNMAGVSIDRLLDKYGLLYDRANGVADAYERMQQAAGSGDVQRMADAGRALAEAILDASEGGKLLTDEGRDLVGQLLQGALQAQALATGAGQAASGIQSAARAASTLSAELRGALGALDALRASAASLGISNIGKAAQLAALKAGRSQAEARIEGIMAEERARLAPLANGPDGARADMERQLADKYAGLRTEAGLDAQLAELTRTKTTGGSGGGSSAQTDAAQDLLNSQREELALLRSFDPVQKVIIQNREALAEATTREAAEIRTNIVELERMRDVRQAVDELGQAGRSAFVGLATGAMSLADALNTVLGKLAEMAASSVWDAIWEGEGGLGEWLLGVFTGGKPAAAAPGKAAGGRVTGPGGPREDNLLHWLSNGEYVVNAAATAANLPLLEAINRGTPAMDLLKGLAAAPKLADGGLVGAFVPPRQVPAVSGSGAPAQVVVHNYSGEPIRQRREQGPNGEALISLVVGREFARGRFDGAQRARYGARPEVGRR